jgi:hypothetical protein
MCFFINALNNKTTVISKYWWAETIFRDICNNCNVIWKYLWFLLVLKSQVLLYYCGLLPTFTIEGNAKFQLEVIENKDVIFSHPRSRTPWDLSTDPLGVHGPQVKNPWCKECYCYCYGVGAQGDPCTATISDPLRVPKWFLHSWYIN